MGRFRDWATCLRCGKRRLVNHREWIKAAGARCLDCGGPLEPSSVASEEHVTHESVGDSLSRRTERKAGVRNRHVS